MDAGSSGRVTHESIAADLAEYVREHPGVCADVSVSAGNHPWVRFTDDEWRLARYGHMDRVEGAVLDEEDVIELFAVNPVNIIPTSEAFLLQSDDTVWEDADEQDVFTDANRCFWCGDSERDTTLGLYDTVEDGECYLCDACRETWDSEGELVATVAHPV